MTRRLAAFIRRSPIAAHDDARRARSVANDGHRAARAPASRRLRLDWEKVRRAVETKDERVASERKEGERRVVVGAVKTKNDTRIGPSALINVFTRGIHGAEALFPKDVRARKTGSAVVSEE